MEKTEGVSYLSDSVIKGQTTPGPTAYDPDNSCVKAKHSASISMRVPSRGLDKPTWRHKKSEKPDMGSYDVETATRATS